MSRIGKMPIPIPAKVQVDLEGDLLVVKGPHGELRRTIHPAVSVSKAENQILVAVRESDKKTKALHGLYRALIANMVTGVSRGFEKVLDIVGVGFRAQVQGNILNMQLGFTHPVNFPFPADIKISTPNPNRIKIEGIDKIKVGEIAAKIRRIFPPEPYKGKGIRYVGEFVRRKQGKAVTK